MRPGYGADDIYRMVEDEFTSTAALFTSHLHHAEYKRLQQLAAARSPTAAKKLARSVNTDQAPMSAELRLQKEAERRRGIIDEALSKSGVRKGKRRNRNAESEDVDSEDSEAAVRKLIAKAQNAPTDQWRGTHLAKLMKTDVASPEKRSGVSLVGMQRISSDTRAARGYGAARQRERESDGRTGAAAGRRAEKTDALGKGRLGEKRSRSQLADEDKDQGEQRAAARPKVKAPPGGLLSHMEKPGGQSATHIKFEDGTSPRRGAGRAKSKLAALFEELDRPSPPPEGSTITESAAVTRSPSVKEEKDRDKRQVKTETSEDKKGVKKERPERRAADEIPLFLVV